MRERKYWIKTGEGKFDWNISVYFDTKEEAEKALAELLVLPWIRFMDGCVIEYTGKWRGDMEEWPED